jgi:hypothetical protein
MNWTEMKKVVPNSKYPVDNSQNCVMNSISWIVEVGFNNPSLKFRQPGGYALGEARGSRGMSTRPFPAQETPPEMGWYFARNSWHCCRVSTENGWSSKYRSRLTQKGISLYKIGNIFATFWLFSDSISGVTE